MKTHFLKIVSGKTSSAFVCGVLSAFFILLSACSSDKADKDITSIIEAWKTADQNQTTVCKAFYQELVDKKQADTSKDCQDSYMEFLGTLNAGHPGGMLPLTKNERGTLHDPRLPENLYVADATILPRAMGNPPILTIMALAKKIAEQL